MWKLVLSAFTLFPIIVAFVLRGRRYKVVAFLGGLNTVVAVAALIYVHKCTTGVTQSCLVTSYRYLVITTINIIAGIVIWYMAFAREDKSNSIPENIATSQLAGSQIKGSSGSREGARKFLKITTWLIVLGIAALVIFIIAAFSAI